MATYPFTPQEQDVIRELGRFGFCYRRETKKAIEFVRDRDQRVVELNREHSKPALVFGFDLHEDVERLECVEAVSDRASSNFRALALGVTRNGKRNHQGRQVVLRQAGDLASLLELAAAE